MRKLLLLISLCLPFTVAAVEIILAPKARPGRVELRVGTSGALIDQVSITVPVNPPWIGSGVTISGDPPIEVEADAKGAGAQAQLTADSSTPLTSGSDIIPMTTIGWEVVGGSAFPPGSFDGTSSQVLHSFPVPGNFNTILDFFYDNQMPVPDPGTYQSRVVFTLSIP